MSKEALAKVIQRSISDAAFRRQLATDPTAALRGYDLTGDEKAALRSGDSGRLTAFGVEQRMSKAFTLGGDGVLGSSVSSSMTSDLSPAGSGALTEGDGSSATTVDTAMTGGAGANADAVIPSDPARPESVITGGNEPRDSAPAWIGEYNASAAVQSPDAAERNFAFASTDEAASAGVLQSPDAADRNLIVSSGSVEPRDVAPTWIGENNASAGLLQSPDAADRNLLQTSGGVEPRDVAPTWIGEFNASTAAQSPDAADRNFAFASTDEAAGAGVQSPDASERNLIDTSGSAEPRDVAPTWIGDNQSLSSVMSDASDATGTDITAATTDEGFLPTVGYVEDAGIVDGGAAHDASEGPSIQP